MSTKPGNTTALIPQASRTWLPNQNGHHASPAINAHSSARSTMALLAASLFALETPVIGVSMSSEPKIDAVSATRRGAQKENLPTPADGFHCNIGANRFEHATAHRVKIAFCTRRGPLISRVNCTKKKPCFGPADEALAIPTRYISATYRQAEDTR